MTRLGRQHGVDGASRAVSRRQRSGALSCTKSAPATGLHRVGLEAPAAGGRASGRGAGRGEDRPGAFHHAADQKLGRTGGGVARHHLGARARNQGRSRRRRSCRPRSPRRGAPERGPAARSRRAREAEARARRGRRQDARAHALDEGDRGPSRRAGRWSRARPSRGRGCPPGRRERGRRAATAPRPATAAADPECGPDGALGQQVVHGQRSGCRPARPKGCRGRAGRAAAGRAAPRDELFANHSGPCRTPRTRA